MGRDADRVKVSACSDWAVRVAAGRHEVAARLRGQSDVRVLLAADGSCWLRGRSADESLQRMLDGLPGGERFEVDADRRCRVPGRHLPVTTLPEGMWLPVREALAVEVPPTASPGRVTAPVPLGVVRGGPVAEGNVLHSTLAALAAWIDIAAEVRFAGLRFVASDNGQVLLHGRPLPPISGDVAIERAGVAVPAGHRLEPGVPHELAAALLSLRTDDLAWFSPDGSCTIVPGEHFVALRRGAVRATAAEVSSRG